MKATFTTKLKIKKVKVASLNILTGGLIHHYQIQQQEFQTRGCLILTMSRTQDSEKCGTREKSLENPDIIQGPVNYFQP